MRRSVLLAEALQGLAQRPGRSMLTALGIVFGVAAVIAMMAIGEGGRLRTLAMAQSMGLSRVIVRPRPDDGESVESLEERQRHSQGLREEDGRRVASLTPGIVGFGLRRESAPTEVIPRPRGELPPLVGVDPQYLEGAALRWIAGRSFTPEEHLLAAPVAILGRGAARQLFGSEDHAVGEQVRVDGVWMRVVGVVEQDLAGGKELEGFERADLNRPVLVPLNSALQRFEPQDPFNRLSEIVFDIADENQVVGLSAVIDRSMFRLHGKVRDFTVEVPLVLLQQNRETQRVFNLVMVLIASISLLVGGIGIMNVMLSSVLERTREIGVRRALGARRGDITRQFLVESALVSMAGGLVGVLVGYGGAVAVARATGWATAVSPLSVVVALVLSIGVGLVFGWWPARRAASLSPTEALRHD